MRLVGEIAGDDGGSLVTPSREWLDGLKVGDAVAVNRGMRRIERVTGRNNRGNGGTILVADTLKFSGESGDERTDDRWHAGTIEPVTDEIRAEIRARIEVTKLERIQWSNVPAEKRARILAIVEDRP